MYNTFSVFILSNLLALKFFQVLTYWIYKYIIFVVLKYPMMSKILEYYFF